MKKKRRWIDRNMTSEGSLTKCVCPICDKVHYVVIFWTGRGIPRKFCRECKNSRREIL